MTRVLFATSEIYPLIKTGGLADVAGALPAALAQEDVSVKVLTPGYPQVLERLREHGPVEPLTSLGDPLGTGPARLLQGQLPAASAETPPLTIWVMDSPSLFQREGGPYVDAAGNDWQDNALRFGAFSKVAARLATPQSPVDWKPQVLHLQDWQTGLAAAYLHLHPGPGPKAATVITIHNIAYAGNFSSSWMERLELPPALFSMHGVEFFGNLSFLKAGVFYSHQITTVSPSHAWEIQTPEGGHGLHGLLAGRSEDVTGILNGADYDTWDPQKDPHLNTPYGPKSLDKKASNRAAVLEEMGLPSPGIDTKRDKKSEKGSIPLASSEPLFGVVGRMTRDKGFDLILEALDEIVSHGSLVVLGSGDPALERGFGEAARRHPRRVAIRIGYDEPLAHRIIAGSDLFLMPSRMEPCGLTQMYSMRYGTPPVVRRVGGLADSVDDADPTGQGTGFVFDPPTPEALAKAALRGASLFATPRKWRKLQRLSMARDLSWERSAARYLEIYRSLIP